MPRGNDVTPAIVRNWCEQDRLASVMHKPYDGVSFTPGCGDSGYRVEVVAHDCPECGFDRMIRRVDVGAETSDEVRYWCLNPNCAHFVSDHLSHACQGSYPQRQASTPVIFE